MSSQPIQYNLILEISVYQLPSGFWYAVLDGPRSIADKEHLFSQNAFRNRAIEDLTENALAAFYREIRENADDHLPSINVSVQISTIEIEPFS